MIDHNQFTGNRPHTMPPPKPSVLVLNILINVVIPVIILTKFSTEESLGPLWGLVIALAFPISYGCYDLIVKGKWNFISIVGLGSVLLTGGLALLKLEGIWFALKEAAIPAVFCIVVLLTLKSGCSIVKFLFLQPSVIDVDLIRRKVEIKEARSQFDKLLAKTTLLLAATFMLSTVLNFVLAIWIIKSPGGTPQYNQELGRMTALTYPVIVIPCMAVFVIAIWYLIRGIINITGLNVSQIVRNRKTLSRKPKG